MDEMPEALPLGLGMALAQDEAAMERFAVLPEEEKRAVIEEAHQMRSRTEMQQLVENIGRS